MVENWRAESRTRCTRSSGARFLWRAALAAATSFLMTLLKRLIGSIVKKTSPLFSFRTNLINSDTHLWSRPVFTTPRVMYYTYVALVSGNLFDLFNGLSNYYDYFK